MGSSPVPHPKEKILFEVVDDREGNYIAGEQRKCTHNDCLSCNLRYICYVTGSWKVVTRKTWMLLRGNRFTKHNAKLGIIGIPADCEVF